MALRRFAEAVDLEFLHRERLHDADAANGFLENRRHIGHALLRAMRRPAQTESEMHDRPDQKRRDDQRDQRELGIRDQDVNQQADERDRLLEEIAHVRRNRGLNLIGVGNESADHLAGRALREESMALIDDVLVQLVPQIANGRQSDLLKTIFGEERREAANHEQNQNGEQHLSPFVLRLVVPPRADAALRAVDRVDQPAALPFRLVAFEDRVDEAILRRRRRLHLRLSRLRQDLIDDRLGQRDENRVRRREDDHRAEGHHGPRLVATEVAVEPPEHVHAVTLLIIASAALRLAPGAPSFRVTSASSRRTRPFSAGSISRRTSLAMRTPFTSLCNSSGTIFFPAMMLTRLKFGSLTRRFATRCVSGDSRYITTTGTPAMAHSSVAVPDDDSATSACDSASPRSCGTMRTNVRASCMIAS